MDLQRIKDVITKQLENKLPLHSLQIQNHIYGCFVMMEDIAQKVIVLKDEEINYHDHVFNLNTHFSEIGLKYGFVISDDLILKDYNIEYKDLWLNIFKDCALKNDIDMVDSTEDNLIVCLKTIIPDEINFFQNALETGKLPDEWLEMVLDVIEAGLNNVNTKNESEFTQDNESIEKDSEKDEILHKEEEKNDISDVKHVVPLINLCKKSHNTRRKIARRLTPSNSKRVLNKTRRHLK